MNPYFFEYFKSLHPIFQANEGIGAITIYEKRFRRSIREPPMELLCVYERTKLLERTLNDNFVEEFPDFISRIESKDL